MGNINRTKITVITVATVILLFTAVVTIVPPQLGESLSIYDSNPASPDPGNIANPATNTKPTLSSTPNVNCAMDTIESLESFLACLGAK